MTYSWITFSHGISCLTLYLAAPPLFSYFFFLAAPSSMAETTNFHSALTVTNVKSLISITLDFETAQYHEWATLFKVQAMVHSVLDI